MEVKYDQSQDLTLILNKIDKALLTAERTRHFYDCTLRGVSKELGAYVFLAYSLDEDNLLLEAENLDSGIGKILIPDSNDRGYPWLINLSDKGIWHLNSGWEPAPRYDGSHKLFIKVKEFER